MWPSGLESLDCEVLAYVRDLLGLRVRAEGCFLRALAPGSFSLSAVYDIETPAVYKVDHYRPVAGNVLVHTVLLLLGSTPSLVRDILS